MFGSTQASQSQSPWATTSTGANATTSAFGGGGTSAFGGGGTGTTSQSAFGGGGTSAFGAGGTGNTSQSAFGGGGTSAFGAGGTGTTSQSAFGGSGTATSGLGGAGTSSSAFGGALKRPSGFGLPSSTLLGGGSGTTSASSPSGTGGIFGSSAIRPGGTGILTPSSSSITQPEHILMKHTYADLPQAAKSEIKALEEMMRGEHNRMNQLGLEYDSWSSAPALALREDMKELSTAHKKLHASITNMCTAVEELKQQVVFEGRYVDYGESLVKGGQLGPQIVASGTGSVLSGYLKAFSKDLSRRRMQGEEKTEQLATYFQSILPSLNSESGLFQEDDLQMTQPAPEDLERWLGDIHNTLRRVAGRISRSDEEVKRVAKEHTNMRKLFYGASGILDPVPSKIPVLEEEKEGKDLVRSFARKWLKREDSQPAALGQAAGASTSALGTTGGRPGGIFGSSALGTTGTTGSALGSLGASSLQSTFGQNVQTGKSAFGVGSTGTSAFGGGATGTSAFGGGATGTSAFGAGATGTSAFGGGSTGTTAFGGGSTRTSAFCGGATGTSAFGGGSTGTTAFGGGSTRTSAFGGGATGTSAFGAGSTSTPAAASSAFGAASSTPNPSAVGGGSAFGK